MIKKPISLAIIFPVSSASLKPLNLGKKYDKMFDTAEKISFLMKLSVFEFLIKTDIYRDKKHLALNLKATGALR